MSSTEKANTADMVKDAIKTLGERGGSSLYNIKKYIEAVYQVDMRYRAPWIRKYLHAAVSSGGLVQTRGRGASGSFKLPPSLASRQRATSPSRGHAPLPRQARAASPKASASKTSSTSKTTEKSGKGKGGLVQTRDRGASGSFKLAPSSASGQRAASPSRGHAPLPRQARAASLKASASKTSSTSKTTEKSEKGKAARR